jgi:predicted GNAT superfamily acetyltransferase
MPSGSKQSVTQPIVGKNMSNMVVIKRLESFQEYLEIENLQKSIWGFSETQIVPSSLLIDIQRHGGLVLGATDRTTGKVVAFLIGYLGWRNGQVKHCSDMMGVLPDFRSKQIGCQLRLRQRNYVLSQGIRLVTWIFDPLEGINACLSVRKLAAISRTYYRDLFGDNFGSFNAGLPTDRLQVEWWIKSPRIQRHLEQGSSSSGLQQVLAANGAVVNQINRTENLPKVVSCNLNLSDPVLLIEIPDNIHLIKAKDTALAMDWRLSIRETLETYFARNYVIMDFLTELHGVHRRNYYVLQHSSSLEEGMEFGLDQAAAIW